MSVLPLVDDQQRAVARHGLPADPGVWSLRHQPHRGGVTELPEATPDELIEILLDAHGRRRQRFSEPAAANTLEPLRPLGHQCGDRPGWARRVCAAR